MKNFIKNYAVYMMMLFMISNITLYNLKIHGLLYQIFMTILIIINALILIIFRKKIKYKSSIIIIYLVILIFSKNALQLFFGVSNIILICVTGFMEDNIIKIISGLLVLFVCIFFGPFLFGYLLTFGTGFDEEPDKIDIYDDTHYYCDNNYEIYSYSAGAMDGFHYSIGKHYEILKIDDIISISYNARNEKTKDEYESYLETHNCELVGEDNEYWENF